MGAFEYTAVEPSGRTRKGVIEGDTPKHARSLLREQQLLPVSVEPVTERDPARNVAFGLKVKGGLSARELSQLTRQLATLVRAGLPLEEALLAVSQQTDRPRVQRVVVGVRAKVLEGHPLAAGLAEFPSIFPEIYRATVSAGEQSGHLDTVLERLSEYTETRQLMQQKVLGALIYPIVLVVFSVLIVTLLLTFVVPKVVEVFESSKAKLPLPTRVLIFTSDLFRHYGIWMLVALALAIWLGIRAWKRPEVRGPLQLRLLQVPVLGKVLRGLDTARFTRTLSILTASAVPVLDAMRIAGEVITNLPMKAAVTEAAGRVREGAPIGRSLGASRLFPPMSIHLISSGEASGELESMLDRAATDQERELDSLLTTLMGLLGPLLIILMGVFVTAIVLSMLLPIFQMNTLIH